MLCISSSNAARQKFLLQTIYYKQDIYKNKPSERNPLFY